MDRKRYLETATAPVKGAEPWEYGNQGTCRALVGFSFGDIDAPAISVEDDIARDQGKNGMVAADPDISSGVPLGSALADDDVAGDDDFAAKFFHAEPLAA